MNQKKDILFELNSVSKSFRIREGIFRRGREFFAVENVSLKILSGQCCGLVGESGSGKTTLAGLLAGLSLPTQGMILFQGQPLNNILRAHPCRFRERVQMVFQNPYLSLDPLWSVEKILQEGMGRLDGKARNLRTGQSLERVGLPENFRKRRPAELSGGERQRVAIARALAVEPEFLILDEPTSQLDVSVQAQVMGLLKELKARLGLGYLFITHDLALVSQIADSLFVLHRGCLAEQGDRRSVLAQPSSAYTRRLIDSLPEWF